jgi:hypothetical protein
MQNVTLDEALSVISEITGRKLDTTILPGWCLMLPTKCMDYLQKILTSRLPFNYQAVYSISRNHHSDDSKTRNDFGIEPRPLIETMRDQVRWMMQEGHIDSSLAGTLKDD